MSIFYITFIFIIYVIQFDHLATHAFDQIQLLRRGPRVLQGPLGRLHAHIGVALPGAHPPFPNAHPLGDPFVRGVHHVGKVLVGDDFFRQKAAGAQDLKTHGISPSPKAARSPIGHGLS